MEFTLPDWAAKIRWRLLFHAIPDFQKLYVAVKALDGKKIHQTEARKIADLYHAAMKGLNEWERRAHTPSRVANGRPLAGGQRIQKVETPQQPVDTQSAVDGYALLVLVYNGIVKEVDYASVFHLYPFSASECRGRDEIVLDLQGMPNFARYTGARLWEEGLPTLSQLYIYGHCEPGMHKMADDTESKILDCAELAMRVKTCGLQGSFSGRVKIFGCSSGKSSDENDYTAFAEEFARRMRLQFKYNDCEFFGYSEDLRFGGAVKERTVHKYTNTNDLPEQHTRNYAEQVVRDQQITALLASGPMTESEINLMEQQIRDRVEKSRLRLARLWFKWNEQRASDVRVQF
jgi:hypothetical protein